MRSSFQFTIIEEQKCSIIDRHLYLEITRDLVWVVLDEVDILLIADIK